MRVVCCWRHTIHGIFVIAAWTTDIMLCTYCFFVLISSLPQYVLLAITYSLLKCLLEFSSSLPTLPGRLWHSTYWLPLGFVWFLLQNGSVFPGVSREPDHVSCLSSPQHRNVPDILMWLTFSATMFFPHGLQTLNMFLLQFSSLILFSSWIFSFDYWMNSLCLY